MAARKGLCLKLSNLIIASGTLWNGDKLVLVGFVKIKLPFSRLLMWIAQI